MSLWYAKHLEVFAYRISPQAKTGMSPAELLLTRVDLLSVMPSPDVCVV